MKMHDKEIKMFCRHRLITTLLLLLVLVTGALGYLTHTPKNSVVLKGRTAVFNCCSNEPSLLYWKHKPPWSQSTKDIYDSSGLLNGYLEGGRFNVTRGNSPECYSLIITDVKRKDAGTYTCIDNEGFGQAIGWELVILESFECEEMYGKGEYMGVNDFGLAQDVIVISCISIFSGNAPNKPICEWSSGTKLHGKYQRVTNTNVSLSLNIQMPATKEMNKEQLSCYIKIEMESSENQYRTTPKFTKFTINYTYFQHKTILHCNSDELSLDCHPSCKISRVSNGSQYCEIGYPSHTDMKVYVPIQDCNEPAKDNVLMIVILVLVVVICVSAIVAIPMGIIIRSLKKKLENRSTIHFLNPQPKPEIMGELIQTQSRNAI